jgi:hypothetical protein
MDQEQLEVLRTIRQFEEIRYGSGRIPCCRASDLVHRVLGFEMQEGFFVSEVLPGVIKHLPHVWNYNPQTREKVDISADQFRGITQKVMIIKDNDEMSENYKGDRLAFILGRMYSLSFDYRFIRRDYKDFLEYQITGLMHKGDPKPVSVFRLMHEILST